MTGAILLGARTRLPGTPMQLSSGSDAYEIDGLFIGVERTDAGRLRVTVVGTPDVSVTARGLGGRTDGLQTEDEAFDLAIRVDGHRLDTMARLDAPARAALREALNGGTMTGGVWSIDLDPLRHATIQDAIQEVLTWARRLLAAARIWVTPSTPVVSLTAMAQTDPVPGVRARALLLLATIDPSLTVARQIAGIDGLASTEVDRIVAAALIAQAEGTGADVPALRAAAARLGASPEREAVELAIEAIHARVGPASVGALSLGVMTGDLSAAVDGGEVSRVDGRPSPGASDGRLSRVAK